MISLETIATELQNALNEIGGANFHIYTDLGDFKKAYRVDNTITDYVNGVLNNLSDDILPINNLEFVTKSVQLELILDVDKLSVNEQGNYVEVENIREILATYIKNTNGSQVTLSEGGIDYTVTTSFDTIAVGDVQQLSPIGKVLPISLGIGYMFVQNGVNSNQVQIILNAETLFTNSAIINRTRVTETNPYSNDKSTKSVTSTNSLSISATLPHLTTPQCENIFEDIMNGKDNNAQLVQVKIGNNFYNYIMIFGNTAENLEVGLNAGMNVDFIEGKPEVLDFNNSLWLHYTKDQTESLTATIPMQSQNYYGVVFWGDGTNSFQTSGDFTHTYSEYGTYEVYLFSTSSIHILSFDANGGSSVSDILVTYNEEIGELPTTVRQYYLFNGWKNNANDEILTPTTVWNVRENGNATAVWQADETPGFIINKYTQGGVTFAVVENATNRIPSDAETIIIPDFYENASVTQTNSADGYIADHNTAVTKLVFLDNMEEIEGTLYCNLPLLSEIVFSSTITTLGNTTFTNLPALKEINLPSSITTIGNKVFIGDGLERFTMPSNVTSFGHGCFSYCFKLSEFSSNTTNYDVTEDNRCLYNKISPTVNSVIGFAPYDVTNEVLLSSYTLPSEITQISESTFEGMTNLNSFNFGSCQMVSNYAFADCSNLETISGTNGITNILNYAFKGCSSLTNIPRMDLLQTIGNEAFNGCEALTSVTFGNALTSIGAGAFSSCPNITQFTLNSNLTSSYRLPTKTGYYWSSDNGLTETTTMQEAGTYKLYEYVDASDYTFTTSGTEATITGYTGTATNKLIAGCKNTTIPSTVTTIGNNAFYGSSLTGITIPNSVTFIGSSAFKYCSGLTSITIPSSVTFIGSSAFAQCSGLTSITIPSSVTTIKSNLFEECSSLTSITIPSSVTTIESRAFFGCNNLTTVKMLPTTPPGLANLYTISTATTRIEVPNASLTAYQTATNWSEYASIMVGV